jgi:hypothetical protein
LRRLAAGGARKVEGGEVNDLGFVGEPAVAVFVPSRWAVIRPSGWTARDGRRLIGLNAA